MGVRRRLRCVAAVWLGLQAASWAAVPFAVCCDHTHAVSSDEHAHCQGMSPELACPLHRQAASAGRDDRATAPAHAHHGGAAAGPASAPPGDADAPALRCVCRVSAAALAAALEGRGVISQAFVLPFAPISEAVTLPDAVVPAPAAAAETPPPRL